ncbi:hypothetical protein Esti_002209 [Eimeria stiedai]
MWDAAHGGSRGISSNSENSNSNNSSSKDSISSRFNYSRDSRRSHLCSSSSSMSNGAAAASTTVLRAASPAFWVWGSSGLQAFTVRRLSSSVPPQPEPNQQQQLAAVGSKPVTAAAAAAAAAAIAVAAAVAKVMRRRPVAFAASSSWGRRGTPVRLLRLLNTKPAAPAAAAAAQPLLPALSHSQRRGFRLLVSNRSSSSSNGSASSSNNSSPNSSSSKPLLCLSSNLCAAAASIPPATTPSAAAASAAAARAAAAAARHRELCSTIEDLNRRYYGGDGEARVSDEVFDALWREVQTLEKRYPQLRHLDSPLRRIGGPHTAAAGAAAAAADCEHLAPVLSLESVYSTAEASRLFNRLDKLARKTQMQGKGEGPVGRRRRCSSQQQPAAGAAAADAAPAAAAAAAAAEGSERSEGDAFVQPLVMEPKVDGQSMSLTYELLDSSNGNSSGSSSSNSSSSRIEGVARYRLVRALTRGDGQVGEDLTNKAFLLAAAGAFPSEFTAAAPAAASAAAAAAAAAGGGLAWPRVVEVRGEAFVVLEDFEETNAERRRSSQKPFASPRSEKKAQHEANTERQPEGRKERCQTERKIEREDV